MEAEINLLPLSKALSTIEPIAIYPEAKRQYEALVQAAGPEGNGPITRLSSLNRNLWLDATLNLDPISKIHLQTLCFAYKTKLRVLHYLSLLGDQFAWAQPLLLFVREHGRDSAFETSATTEEAKPCEQLRLFIEQKQRELGISIAESSKSAEAAKSNIPKPMFIISTLPFAIPTAFFTTLGTQGPPSILQSSESLLFYPATFLIAFEPDLKSTIRQKYPPWPWSPDIKRQMHSPAYKKEQTEWDALFEHLSQDTFRLMTNRRVTLEIEKTGYGIADLHLWRAGWLAERSKEGNSEKGKAERARLRERGAGSSSAGREDGGSQGGGGGGKGTVETITRVVDGVLRRFERHVAADGREFVIETTPS